jgi:hypothetical protein
MSTYRPSSDARMFDVLTWRPTVEVSDGPGIMKLNEQVTSRRFPVTITQLPVTRCQICHRTVAYWPARQPHVFAVAAAWVFCVHFPARWTHYLNSVSAAGSVQVPFSLLFLELSGNCVNVVQIHVDTADILVRRGIDGDGFRYPCRYGAESVPPIRSRRARRSPHSGAARRPGHAVRAHCMRERLLTLESRLTLSSRLALIRF